MGKGFFLDTGRTCFLCAQGSLSQFENGVSEISLQSVCRYLSISSSSILRTVSYENFSTEESQSKKEECQFSVTMCSTCSSLTSELTDLITQLEMLNKSIAYQLQIFHQTMNGSKSNDNRTDFHRKPVERMIQFGSSSEVETSLVETLRAGIISKCRNLPEVHLELLKSGNEEKAGKSVDPIETGLAPPTTIDISSLLPSSSSPLLEDPLSLSPDPEMDPLSDQAVTDIPQDSRALQLEAISNKLLVSDTCKKYSKMSLNKVHCSLCNYSNATCDAEKFVRIHLLNVHPEIVFTSERLLHTDTKVTFNDRCRKLLSIEISRAKQRGGSTPNGKPCYHCGFCDRKFICANSIKPHLLTEHLKIIKTKLKAGYSETLSLKERRRPKILQRIRTPTDKTGDKAEIFIVPDEIVKEIIETDEKRKNSQPIHDDKSFVCSKEDGGCGKVFPQRWRLTDHKKRRCKNLSERDRWTCEFSEGGCGKGFASKYNLHQHQKLRCPKTIAQRQDDKSQTSENFKVAFGMEYSVKDVVIYK